MRNFLADIREEAPLIVQTDYGATFAKMLLTLAGLVGLMLLTYWLIRRLFQQRLQRNGGMQRIQIIEKRMISPKTTLYLIEVEKNTRVLVAESQLEIKKLETIPQNALDTSEPNLAE